MLWCSVFRFEGLEIFRLAVELAAEIHSVSRQFPREEIFGLRANLRRAAASIALNIAEGAGRGTRKNFAHFIDIATGSLFETIAAAHLAHRMRYISQQDLDRLRSRSELLARKLAAFKRTLRP